MMHRRRWLWVSLALNLILITAVVIAIALDDDAVHLRERHIAGDPNATDKVAVIRIRGALLEGANGFAFAQIERAATDSAVKAIVVRVESPGGTIGAAEQLHQALTELRDNNHTRFVGSGPKPLFASFGSVAASGGYYLAMPCQAIYAEPTTITGSIGVFVALPNVAELAQENGVKLIVIKAGDVKAGGSPLQPLLPADRRPWQEIVDYAYGRFLDVVVAGRPKLNRAAMTEPVLSQRVSLYDDRGNVTGAGPEVSRKRADGGTFTPPQALELGLIDGIATLPDVATLAAQTQGLARWRAVGYDEPKSWWEWVTGVKLATPQNPTVMAERLMTPQILLLAPQYEATFAATSIP